MAEEKLKKMLAPADIVVCRDSREQLPLDLSPLSSITKGLQTGDYSLLGLEHKVAIERKSLQDLIACVGRERERFDREIQRLLSYEVRALFVEGDIAQIEMKMYRGQVPPNVILSSIMGWMARGIPVLFCQTHQQMGVMVSKYLYIVAQRYWRELYPLFQSQMEVKKVV